MNSNKLLLIGGVVLVILFVVVTVLSLSGSKTPSTQNAQSSGSTSDKTNSNEETTQTSGTGSLKVSGSSGQSTSSSNSVYKSVESLTFIPNQINDFVINKDQVESTAKQTHPELETKPLVPLVNKTIFQWLALNNYYQSKDPTKVSSSYSNGAKRIDSFIIVEDELDDLIKSYNTNVYKADGLYMKVRFNGTTDRNVKALNVKRSELKSLAKTKIEEYRKKAMEATDKQSVLDEFNKDKTVILLNNQENSKKFTDNSLYPPIVDDVNYFSMIEALPVGQLSDIITLRAKQSSTVEEYAYAVFYLSKKDGSNVPVNALANAYISKAKIN